MARKIEEIKDSITEDFMRSDEVARVYGFNVGDSFTAHFSKVSVESVLFYIFACAAWVIECLFDQHKQEVSEQIEQILPHRPKWYRDKTLRFMQNKTLIADTDQYDTTDMTEDEIAAAKPVKHAVAVENKDASILTIKVAGESAGKRCKLDPAIETQLLAYISEIKDAGVRINLVNIDADTFNCSVDVYYDAMLLPENVEDACRKAIKSYIENLPFNGEYTNMALVDELQKVEGVKIVEFKDATTSASDETLLTSINARYIPAAGYFAVGNLTINLCVNE